MVGADSARVGKQCQLLLESSLLTDRKEQQQQDAGQEEAGQICAEVCWRRGENGRCGLRGRAGQEKLGSLGCCWVRRSPAWGGQGGAPAAQLLNWALLVAFPPTPRTPHLLGEAPTPLALYNSPSASCAESRAASMRLLQDAVRGDQQGGASGAAGPVPARGGGHPDVHQVRNLY